MRFVAITTAAGVLLMASHSHASAQGQSPLDQTGAIAAGSKCASVSHAPKAYMRGIALVFAKTVCQPERADVKIVSAAKGAPGTGSDRTDALTWYDSKFHKLGMSNAQDGVGTLRLGMLIRL